MNEKRASKRFRNIIFSLTAFMVLFAWIHSCFPASISSKESEGVLQFVYGFFKLFGLDRDGAEHVIRKVAHFSEFAAIGGLLLSCAYCFDRFKPHRFYVYVLFAGLLTAVVDETNIPVVASGGCGNMEDIYEVFVKTDCSAALAASIFHYNECTVQQVHDYLRERGIEVR